MVVPEKENHLALRACSALARAMQDGKFCALVRFVAREKGAMQLGCLTPLLGKPPLLCLLVIHVQACWGRAARGSPLHPG